MLIFLFSYRDTLSYRVDRPAALPVAQHANADAAAALQAHELRRCQLRVLPDKGVQRDICRKVAQIHYKQSERERDVFVCNTNLFLVSLFLSSMWSID